MKAVETWRLRLRTLEAIGWLILAKGLVAWVPMRLWSRSLGEVSTAGDTAPADLPTINEARRLARHVERAGARIPFATKCLPRAMALAWALKRRGFRYALKIAARPRHLRGGRDDLHAWIECGGAIILGDLPGPWLVLHERHT